MRIPHMYIRFKLLLFILYYGLVVDIWHDISVIHVIYVFLLYY